LFSKELWFHEDDYAQVQFLPLSCWNFCCDQLDKLAAHDVEHRAPDGVGWTKMYSLPAAPALTASLGVSIGDLAAAMTWKLRRTNRILTGTWSGKGEKLPHTAAYRSGDCAIVFSWNEDRIIESLWFKDGYASWWSRHVLLEAFFRIGTLAPLLLVDWRGALIDLRDRKVIRGYLENVGGDSEPSDNAASVTEESNESAQLTQTQPAPQPPPRPDSLFRFDGPVRPARVTRKTLDGPAWALLDDARGRAWAVEVDAKSLGADEPVVATPVNLGGDVELIDWCELAENKIVFWRIDGLRERLDVRDTRDGRVLYSALHAATAVLAPDGRHLLIFEDDGIAIADLDEPEKPARQSGLFPTDNQESDDKPGRLDLQLDEPSSAMAVATESVERFTLAIGDYGFAAVAEVRIGGADEPPLIVTEAARAFSKDLVYDPVEIVDVVPGESLLVQHGYGSGITRFDLQAGTEVKCPLPGEQTESDYGTFRNTVSSLGSPLAWVQTNIGPYFWTGTGPLKRVSEDACMVLATDGDRYLGISLVGWDIIRGRFWTEANLS